MKMTKQQKIEILKNEVIENGIKRFNDRDLIVLEFRDDFLQKPAKLSYSIRTKELYYSLNYTLHYDRVGKKISSLTTVRLSDFMTSLGLWVNYGLNIYLTKR